MKQAATLRAVIFDWAGTIIDYGSRAPTAAFLEIFRRAGVEITTAEAREPMGRAKRDHIMAILSGARVANAWRQTHGRLPTDADIDRLYGEFLPLQIETISQYADVIPGVAAVVSECHRRGLSIGSTTGYTRALMDVIVPIAARQELNPSAVICADDVPQGRPAPWMLFRAAEKLNAFPPSAVVVVDDTPVGVQAGQNAGMWTVAVTKSGNSLGLSEAEAASLDTLKLKQRIDAATAEFKRVGADYVIETVADLLPALDDISARLQN